MASALRPGNHALARPQNGAKRVRVSIIISIYNELRHAAEMLKRVAAASLPPYPHRFRPGWASRSLDGARVSIANRYESGVQASWPQSTKTLALILDDAGRLVFAPSGESG